MRKPEPRIRSEMRCKNIRVIPIPVPRPWFHGTVRSRRRSGPCVRSREHARSRRPRRPERGSRIGCVVGRCSGMVTSFYHEAGWRAPSHHAHGCAVRCARVQEHRGDECSSLSRAEVARELSGRCALGPLPGASASRPTLAASAWRRLWVPRRLDDLDLQSPRPAVVHPESGHRAPRPGRRAATARAWQMVSWRLTFGSPAAPERRGLGRAKSGGARREDVVTARWSQHSTLIAAGGSARLDGWLRPRRCIAGCRSAWALHPRALPKVEKWENCSNGLLQPPTTSVDIRECVGMLANTPRARHRILDDPRSPRFG